MKTPATQSLLCPHCKTPVNRVPRGALDRLISLFVPMWRFACPAPLCGWQDLVRRGAPGTAHHVRGRAYAGRKPLAPARGGRRAALGPTR